MFCQKARVVSTGEAYRRFLGLELWVEAKPPEPHMIRWHDSNETDIGVVIFDSPLYDEDTMRPCGIPASAIELIPEFADIEPSSFQQWWKELNTREEL